jgi:hypothetical protein
MYSTAKRAAASPPFSARHRRRRLVTAQPGWRRQRSLPDPSINAIAVHAQAAPIARRLSFTTA